MSMIISGILDFLIGSITEQFLILLQRIKTKNTMTTQIFWILLVEIAVAQVERPLFVSSANELSDTPLENRQEWLHPVIFEPQNKIQLTHSTYQVTTFLDFASFVNGFNNVQTYIKNFKKDIHDPANFSMIRHKSTNPCTSPLLNEQDLAAFMQSAYCLSMPYAYMTRLKIDRFLMEVNYLEDLFDVVYRKFLNAIDHIDYHPTFILTKITLMAWFCLKHRKSVSTLLKIGLPLARKIKDNPQIIEQMTQRVAELVTSITPPEPPPRVPIDAADSPTLASKWSRKESPMIAPLTSIAVPPSLSGAHRHTLELITEAAQELYAKGQLCVKSYAGYLKGKCMQSHTQDSPL